MRSSSLPVLLICTTLICLQWSSYAHAKLAHCSYHDQRTGSEYQLGMMTLGGGQFYSVRDTVETVLRNFTYDFNVCGEVAPPIDKCKQLNAPAWQYDKDGNCHRLGVNTSDAQWALVDESDPSLGVQLTYKDGDVCHQGKPNQKSRSLTIQFICSDALDHVPDSEIIEHDCDYTVMFYSAYGCPLQCPFSGREMCAGHGFCAFDSGQHKAKCFCYDGWGGQNGDCSQQLESNGGCKSGLCIALAFIVVILALLVMAAIVHYYRLHKLSQLNITFAALTESFVGDEERGRSSSDGEQVEMNGRTINRNNFEIGSAAEDL